MAEHTVQFQRQRSPADGVHAELGTLEKVPESGCRQHLSRPLGIKVNRWYLHQTGLFPGTRWDCRDPVQRRCRAGGP